jgi:hypothetical protein
MAIQMSLTLENGVVLSDAYLVVCNINFEYKDVASVNVVLNVYKDKDTYDAGKPEITQLKHKCSGGSFTTYFSQEYLNNLNKNHVSSAYEWLLSLEPYFDAEEV